MIEIFKRLIMVVVSTIGVIVYALLMIGVILVPIYLNKSRLISEEVMFLLEIVAVGVDMALLYLSKVLADKIPCPMYE